MVYRMFVEKKPGFDNEAAQPAERRCARFLGMTNLTGLRLFNRYDVEGIDAALFDTAREHRVLRAAGGRRLRRAARSAEGVGLCRGVPARPVRPAGRLLPPSASSSWPRASAPWCALPGCTCSKGSLSDEELDDDQAATSSTPWRRREASLEKPGHPAHGATPCPPPWRSLERLHRLWTRQSLDGFIASTGLAMDLDDICSSARTISSSEQPRPHHHRDPA